MEFKIVQSEVRPLEVEKITDNRYYIRKDIVVKEDSSLYEYKEALISDVEYAVWSATQNIETKREAEIIDEYTLQLIDEGVL